MDYEPHENYQKTEHYVMHAPRRTLWRGVVFALIIEALLIALAVGAYRALTH